jgi:hypothetical protein
VEATLCGILGLICRNPCSWVIGIIGPAPAASLFVRCAGAHCFVVVRVKLQKRPCL